MAVKDRLVLKNLPQNLTGSSISGKIPKKKVKRLTGGKRCHLKAMASGSSVHEAPVDGPVQDQDLSEVSGVSFGIACPVHWSRPSGRLSDFGIKKPKEFISHSKAI